jgi:hypothetical protein
MRQHKCLDAGFLRYAANALGRRVVSFHVRHESFEFDRPTFGDLTLSLCLSGGVGDRGWLAEFQQSDLLHNRVVYVRCWHKVSD